VLFNDTIHNNIRVGREGATADEVVRAAQQAFAHDFIELLPKKYETLVGERGTRLSGGQRQRIAIARAFLKNAPILILDEATSNLDSESEAMIQRALSRLVEGRTTLIIAHRFSTLKIAQQLLVFERGEITARGSSGELLAKSERYRALYELQPDLE
jgi:subfamily B ATP-binding cassette protein MsbA